MGWITLGVLSLTAIGFLVYGIYLGVSGIVHAIEHLFHHVVSHGSAKPATTDPSASPAPSASPHGESGGVTKWVNGPAKTRVSKAVDWTNKHMEELLKWVTLLAGVLGLLVTANKLLSSPKNGKDK